MQKESFDLMFGYPKSKPQRRKAQRRRLERDNRISSKTMGLPTPWHEVERMFPDVVQRIDDRINAKEALHEFGKRWGRS